MFVFIFINLNNKLILSISFCHNTIRKIPRDIREKGKGKRERGKGKGERGKGVSKKRS